MTNRNNPELLTVIAEHKMERMVADSEIQRSVTGQLFENLPLTGDLSLRRELFEDGSKGAIEMRYVVTGSFGFGDSWTERAQSNADGEVRHSPGSINHDIGEPLSGFRRAVLAVKIMKGRPDHWDKETDFYGLVEEYED